MTELTMERLRENLESLKMKNTLEILDNYLERAVKDELNIVEVLDHIFAEKALSKRRSAARHRFSTYYINYHTLIEQLKKAHFQNRLPDKLKTLGKYPEPMILEITSVLSTASKTNK